MLKIEYELIHNYIEIKTENYYTVRKPLNVYYNTKYLV